MYGVYFWKYIFKHSRYKSMYTVCVSRFIDMAVYSHGVYTVDRYSHRNFCGWKLYTGVHIQQWIHRRNIVGNRSRRNVYGVYNMHGGYKRDTNKWVFRHNWTRNVFVFV